MKTSCPFCRQACDIETEQFDREIKCSVCNRSFSCSIVATPLVGPMYLDIETTAAPEKSSAEISCIVWWCNREWNSWVNGRDDPEAFLVYWRHASELITFNGKAFNVSRHPKHIDVFVESRHVGMSGGLKEIGATLGFPRPRDLDKVDGAAAIRLWRKYCFDGDSDALKNLLHYSAWDVTITYLLHMRLIDLTPEPIYETIPFPCDQDIMASVLPKPRWTREASERKIVGRIQDYWEERKRNPLLTLRGAEVCFTCDLARIEREDAEALIQSLGGKPKTTAVRTLDFLVVGDTEGFGRTTKMDKAEANIAQGAHTRIIKEFEFWAMVARTRQSPV